MYCKNCGKEIDDNAIICPNCGVATDNMIQKPIADEKRVNGVGIAGFVMSLLSIWLGVYFCIASIIGLVLSIAGMAVRKKYNSCNGLAIAGLVLGIVSLILWGLVWLIVGAAILSV